MEVFRGREGQRQEQPDTVTSVSADTHRTVVGSQRAPRAKVCQTCIDVWESCLGLADRRDYEGLMIVPPKDVLYKCMCAFSILLCDS